MEWLGCIAAFIGLTILGAIINSISNASKKRKIREIVQEGFKLKIQADKITTDAGQNIDFMRVLASGACIVPSDGYSCNIHFYAVDVTDGDSDDLSYPIISLFPDMADENGFMFTTTELTIPYQITTFTELQIGVIIPDALVLPKRGSRKVRVQIWITPSNSPSPVFKTGHLDLTFTQKTYGYLERAERDLAADKLVVELAVLLSASDNNVEEQEINTIYRFFEQRSIRNDNPEKYREAISDTINTEIKKVQNFAIDIPRRLKSLSTKLNGFNDNGICQDAYELCTQIATADERISEEEQQTLKLLAAELQIDPGFSREIHDRYFRVDMFQERSKEALLDMPLGLSHEEQVAFLNQEYKKWRSRVTHKDAKIRTEAEIRLKRITERRREIDESYKE